KSNYEEVRRFLIEISADSKTHINWNWARWEWMYFHPEFDRASEDKIGLWYDDDKLVGAAIYDHYFGEAFFAVKAGHEQLETAVLDYMTEAFSDENGLGVAVNDEDERTAVLLLKYGFTKHEQTENVLELSLDGLDITTAPCDGVEFTNIDVKADLYKHHELLWKGFDHDGEAPVDEETMNRQRTMLSAPNLNEKLHVAAINKDGEYVAYCGAWYDKSTDYVYIEPVCTVPQYRGRGIAKAVLFEALNRSYDLGARKAYVISEMDFYKRLGFKQYSHYTFYWYKK
ncbi:MAG: GNAT family N-acetyltransferase, partial [Oscillospiraceae bacterium]|nr:GNAT family N-acetyltransferase [Oscillospiraceae bacterium]